MFCLIAMLSLSTPSTRSLIAQTPGAGAHRAERPAVFFEEFVVRREIAVLDDIR